jgi:hypothetical protein
VIYIYRSNNSSGARMLAQALEGRRVRTFPSLQEGDRLVAWGSYHAYDGPVPTLNNKPLISKLTAANTLRQAGVPTIHTSEVRPSVYDPGLRDSNLRAPDSEGIDAAVERVGEALNYNIFNESLTRSLNLIIEEVGRERALLREEWLPRLNNHIAGNDLLSPPSNPDFYVKKERLVEEYRIHSFLGKSIRAGKKIPNPEGEPCHEWIRSFPAGWRMSYQGVESQRGMRSLAKSAVEALSLDFGAVDIGIKEDGSMIVLEVNRAPGLMMGTLDKYQEAIQRWMGG